MRIVDVIAYLRTMEQAIVATLADAGLESRGRPDDGPDYTGVWVADRKIASIGVHVARGVTTTASRSTWTTTSRRSVGSWRAASMACA